jgi:GAF domain-containing protein
VKPTWDALTIAASAWWWLSVLGGVAFAVAGLVADKNWWVSVPATVIGSAAIYLDAQSKRKMAQFTDDQSSHWKVLLDDCLQPLARSLLRLAVKTTDGGREKELVSTLQVLLAAALSLTSAKRSRATLFCRVKVGKSDILEPHPMFTVGRGDEPKSKFVRGRGEGKDVWAHAEAGRTVFYPNLNEDAPPGMDLQRERTYCAFITAPIFVGPRLVGLLTINSTEAGGLTESDKAAMTLLGALAGVALAISAGKWPQSDADLN